MWKLGHLVHIINIKKKHLKRKITDLPLFPSVGLTIDCAGKSEDATDFFPLWCIYCSSTELKNIRGGESSLFWKKRAMHQRAFPQWYWHHEESFLPLHADGCISLARHRSRWSPTLGFLRLSLVFEPAWKGADSIQRAMTRLWRT